MNIDIKLLNKSFNPNDQIIDASRFLHEKRMLVATPVSQVNTYTVSDQLDPSIAILSNGYVIIWRSYGQTVASQYDLIAQRFSLTGVPQGSEIRVNDNSTLLAGDIGRVTAFPN